MMATLESTKFIPFVFPPSNPTSCNRNRNILWPPSASQPAYSPGTSGSQEIRGPAAPLSLSGCQAEVDGKTVARTEGCKLASANNDEDLDGGLPSLEELFETPAMLPNTKTSEAERTLRHLEQAARDAARTLVDQTKSGLGERQGDALDRPVILDNDESDENESPSADVERDTSLHYTVATSALACEPTKSIDIPSLWFDVEEGYYVEESALTLEFSEQRGVTPAQEQRQTFRSSQLPHDQINQQDISNITQNMSTKPAPHPLPQLLPSGDEGWADDTLIGLELALVEQVNSSSAGVPSSPRPHLVEAPHTVETLGKELQEDELAREKGGAEMPPQEELVGRKGDQPLAVGDEQGFVAVDDTDSPKDKEVAETPPAVQFKTDQHRFRLRGIRTRQLAGCQTKTTQYRVVWGEHPNRSDSWVNEDDIRVLMLWPLGEQDLISQIETSVRVQQMRCSRRSKGKKLFEFLVDGLSTWITEDQLRISLSSTSVVELKESPYPLSQAQSEVNPRHLATPISDEHRHTPPATRNPSPTPSSPAPGSEPGLGRPGKKRWRQDTHTEVSSKIHHPVNAEDTCDTGDEDPRPAKRRKPRSAPTVTPPFYRQSTPLESPSTTRPEIDEAQPQDDHGCSSTFIDDEQHSASWTSQSPHTVTEAAPFAEYQEWPFQGFLLKRTKIGDDMMYNLEFKLPSISERLNLRIDPGAPDNSSSGEPPARPTLSQAIAYSKMYPAAPMPRKKRVPFTPEEDEKLLDLQKQGLSWKDIGLVFPDRSEGTLRARHLTISLAKASEIH